MLHRQGPLNIASYVPKGHLPPDFRKYCHYFCVAVLILVIGPRIQSSSHNAGTYALQLSDSGTGHNLAHCTTPENSNGTPRWDIWPHENIFHLSQVLEPSGSVSAWEQGEPILRRKTYLNIEHIEDAISRGAIPWSCEQQLGEILFIPAGCPYQVGR